MNDVGNFKIELDSFIEEIKDKTAEAVREVSKQAFMFVVAFSPKPQNALYSRGSYVLSHRIGINTLESDYTIVPGDEDQKDFGAQNEALSLIGKLDRVKAGDTVIISNSIPWADKVEYIGWYDPPRNHPPYNTYKKAVAGTNEELNNIIAEL